MQSKCRLAMGAYCTFPARNIGYMINESKTLINKLSENQDICIDLNFH